jgi:hypothetical protein
MKAEKKRLKKIKDKERYENKKKKRITRDGHVCTCGVLEHFNCLIPSWHMEDCIIYKENKDAV